MLAAGVVLVAVLVVMGCPWPCSREPTTRSLALLDSAPSWQRRLLEDGSSAPGGRLRGLAHQRKEHRRAELLLDSTCGASDARRYRHLPFEFAGPSPARRHERALARPLLA